MTVTIIRSNPIIIYSDKSSESILLTSEEPLFLNCVWGLCQGQTVRFQKLVASFILKESYKEHLVTGLHQSSQRTSFKLKPGIAEWLQRAGLLYFLDIVKGTTGGWPHSSRPKGPRRPAWSPPTPAGWGWPCRVCILSSFLLSSHFPNLILSSPLPVTYFLSMLYKYLRRYLCLKQGEVEVSMYVPVDIRFN